MNCYYRRGVYLPDIDLWLDPRDRKGVAFVSHAHSDHIGSHGLVLTTPGTAALMRHRLGRRSRYRSLEFGRTYSLAELRSSDPKEQRRPATNSASPRRGGGRGVGSSLTGTDARITLYPAGHVLGSAQALVETDAGRLLYSGDFKLRPGLAAEPIEIPRADVVVMETTFGRPNYVFPPTDQVLAAIRDFCRRALAEGATPVLLAYALGKGPELVAQLGSDEWELTLHPALFEVVKRYEELGVTFPPHRRLETRDAAEASAVGHRRSAVICPPHLVRDGALASLPRRRTAYVSGWALDRGAAYRYGVDACFPLSDHADYPELLEYVRRAGARRVFTLHGFDQEFAQDLRLIGYDARSLSEPVQPSLF